MTTQPTAEQQAAIMAPVDAAVRVLAGPGAGKTFVIAQRYAHLLGHGAKPERIAAITFSRDMAHELRKRILRVSPRACVDNIATIHGLCWRILKASGDKRTVAKEWQERRALKVIHSQLWPSRKGDKPKVTVGDVANWVNGTKAHGLWHIDDVDMAFGEKVAVARQSFDDALAGEKLVTFADMLLDVERHLRENEGFRQRWQGQFGWIIVDEGQDTGAQAMRIVRELAAPENRLFIVGDADQLLYLFSGAVPEENLHEGFEAAYPDGKTYMLNVNHRSTRAIVAAQMRLIRNNYKPYGGPYEARYQKQLSPNGRATDGVPVSWNWHDTDEAEATWLASKVGSYVSVGRSPGEMFVGARTRAQLGLIEVALAERQVGYTNIAGGSFWALPHVTQAVDGVAAYDEINELEVLVRIGEKHPTLQSFVAYARSMERRAQAEQMTDNRVVLSTIHRLKGQERAIVFGVGWCEGTVLLRRDGETVEQPIGYLPHGRALQSDAQKGLADERCLAFVLISRARELCHLSGFAVAQGGRTLKPSRFIEEALG